MKKVLFVATVASHIKTFHIPYLKLFHSNKYKVYVAANWNLNDKDKLKYCDEFIEIPIERSPYSFKNLMAIRKLKKIIEKERFDIIHCHTPMGGVVARLAGRTARNKYGTRIIYTAHGFHFYNGAPIKNWLLFYPVEKYLSKFTDALITINTEDYELAKKKFSKRCKEIEYLPGVGIDTNKFNFIMTKNEKIKLRKSLGLKESDFVFIFPARLDKNKNQIFLINCMGQLTKKYKNIHLLLVGKDELSNYYQDIVNEKKLNKNIHFLGYRSDIPQLLNISDVAVSSSRREGLPINIIESFACGLPAIAIKCRGMSDLIKNGINGYLIEEDIKQYVNVIARLYSDKKLYKKISLNNKKEIDNYSIELIIKKIKKIYKI